MIRKNHLVNGEVYHVCSKSIAGFKIFNTLDDFERMRQLIKYYKTNPTVKFSDFMGYKSVLKSGFDIYLNDSLNDRSEIIQIIAYSFMPTHIHLVLKQLIDDGIPIFMQRILNSYSSYFNATHKRKGPLWESRYNGILVDGNDLLNHVVRYLHLNSTTAKLTNKPEDWAFSSYREYLGEIDEIYRVCKFDDLLDIKPSAYRRFVNDQISYQRELSKIKKLLF
jgi:putative transposase